LGLKVAIVEKDKRLGGTCTLRGCIPTKTTFTVGPRVTKQMQHAADFGVRVRHSTGLLPRAETQRESVMKNS